MFVVQDFFKNFAAFVRANDTVSLCDLTIDEIAKIIVFDKGKMIEALRKVDPKIKDNISDAQMISAIIKYGQNEQFVNYVAKIITINNSEGHTVTDAYTANIKKALMMFLKGNNERLLANKVRQHHKIKEMNFGTGDEEILKYKKRMTMKKVALWGVGIVLLTGAGYVGWRMYKAAKLKKGAAASSSAATSSTSEGASSSSSSSESSDE